MENIKSIRKVHMNCPLCDKIHEVDEITRISVTEVKDEEVSYEEKVYCCGYSPEEENEFCSGSMINDNMLKARNAYRLKKGLLTSDEIVAIRECYGLSQVDLARLLGWGDATISRYESKAIQDEAYDVMLRLIKDDPLKALELLKKNAHKFPIMKRMKIRENMIDKLNSWGKEFLTRQTLKGEYVSFEEMSDSNGFTLLNIDKIEAMISYIAGSVDNLFKVKLMKMLWYSDVLAFVNNSCSMSGLVYRHEPMGALPVGHYSLMNLERLNVKEEESYTGGTMIHIYPSADMNYSVLSTEDINILDRVINKFKNFKAKDIVEYMHRERAYRETSPGAIIPFSLTKDIKSF